MSTPELLLRTLWVLDRAGRIVAAREPGAPRGPAFSLLRGVSGCAWALRHDVPDALAAQVDALARTEPAVPDLAAPPVHEREYRALLGETKLFEGPAFEFPDGLERPSGLVTIEDEAQLAKHFRGWVPGEIAEGRAPVVAWVEDGAPVSICFCARRSDEAAEAGLETAEGYRGRGLGPRVTAGWAHLIRASGRVPMYSTAWTNHASRAVARKLGLRAYASNWNLSGLAPAMPEAPAHGRTDTASLEVIAAPDAVYEAFVDSAVLMCWLPPGSMTGRALEYDFREGGRYRIELRYEEDAPEHGGKTSENTDVSTGRFVALERGRRIVQTVEFDSEDAAFAGEMTMTWSFEPTNAGTKVTVTAQNVPSGISRADHGAGLRASLDNLARYLS